MTSLRGASAVVCGRRRSRLCLACLAVASGCERTTGVQATAAHRDLPVSFSDRPALPTELVERSPYRLNVGDVLEVIYHVRTTPAAHGHRLEIEDPVDIRFPYQKEYNQSLVVQSDGKINCLLIGPVHALNLTPPELEAQLKSAYATYLREPELTVVTRSAHRRIDELKKAVTTSPRGQSRLMPIKPDGTIDLPYVGEVVAYGRTVKELRDELNRRYADDGLAELEVTVQTLEFARRHVYVMGEVNAPGMLAQESPLTVLQALASVGGTNVRADRRHVLVIRRKFLPIAQAVVLDVDDMLDARSTGPDGPVLDGDRFRHDFWLQDGDVVYVPTTELARTADWIDLVFNRSVRPIFPVSGQVGMNFGYEIHEAPKTLRIQR